MGWVLDELDDGCKVRNNIITSMHWSIHKVFQRQYICTYSSFQPKTVRTTQLFVMVVKPKLNAKPNESNFQITFNTKSTENHSLRDSKIMDNYNASQKRGDTFMLSFNVHVCHCNMSCYMYMYMTSAIDNYM